MGPMKLGKLRLPVLRPPPGRSVGNVLHAAGASPTTGLTMADGMEVGAGAPGPTSSTRPGSPKPLTGQIPLAKTPGRPYLPSTLWRGTGWCFVLRAPDRSVRRSSGHGRGKFSASAGARCRKPETYRVAFVLNAPALSHVEPLGVDASVSVPYGDLTTA